MYFVWHVYEFIQMSIRGVSIVNTIFLSRVRPAYDSTRSSNLLQPARVHDG